MTWYSSEWKRRYPIGVDVLGGAETSGSHDVQIVFPSDWDDFWDNIRSDGFDIIVTDSMGTLQTFHRTSFNFSNRALTLSAQSVTFANRNSINIVYVYFNNSDQSSDLQSAFVPSGPKIGKVFLNAPSNRIVSQPSQKTGSTTPNFIFSKTSDDEVYIWFRVASLLASRIVPYNDKLDLESIDYIKIQSLDSAGSNDAARYNESLTVVIPGYVGVSTKAGSNNTDYTVVCEIRTVATNFNQTISLRALLQIRDLLPI
tara:strand:+ start:3224 stop:3994 length:771 start_codon:yes stop_codon:yes gene_type:complete